MESQIDVFKLSRDKAHAPVTCYVERVVNTGDTTLTVICGGDAYTAHWPAPGCDGLFYIADFSHEELARELTPSCWINLSSIECHVETAKLDAVSLTIVDWMRGYTAKLEKASDGA